MHQFGGFVVELHDLLAQHSHVAIRKTERESDLLFVRSLVGLDGEAIAPTPTATPPVSGKRPGRPR
ncbi:hypothetical protein Jiend_20090 [Micromonospora endophytica]|nr:hypothetical protein Jiend_20090 [Micromonospora endophytica]